MLTESTFVSENTSTTQVDFHIFKINWLLKNKSIESKKVSSFSIVSVF